MDHWYKTHWHHPDTQNALTGEGLAPLLPEYVFTRLAPALELASSMLDLSAEFMTRILCAPTLVSMDEETKKQDMTLDPEYETTEADRIKYKDYLCQLPDFQLICFGHPVAHLGSEVETHVRMARCGCKWGDQSSPFCIWYEFGSPFIDFYTSTEWMRFSDEHIQRINMYFAKVIVHEFAHGVGHARYGHPTFADRAGPSPYAGTSLGELLCHPDHRERELGRAWENSFGGAVFCVGMDTDRMLTRPDIALLAHEWIPRTEHGSDWREVDQDVLEILSKKIRHSNLSVETLARVAASGTSLELVNMAEKLAARGRRR